MGREFNEGKPRMWVVLLLRGGVSPKLFTFHLISCTTDCKRKLFSTASVKNVSETLKITVTVLNCRWCVRRWNRCCANTICFDLHIDLGHKKKKKIKPWHDCAKNIFELESINAVLEKYVNCSIYGDILYATFKY